MTPQEVSDRLEIQDLLVRYCHAVDNRDWQAFEAVFARDAVLDFTAFGGPRSGVEDMAAYLRAALSGVQGTQHTISTSLMEIGGKTARARTAAQVMMISANGDGGSHVLFIGLWYRDTLVATPQGWRICERVQERSWIHNLPAAMQL